MGGRGPRVGTASVEIVPDMSKFRGQVERSFRRSNLRNEIKKELSAAERSISQRMKGIGDKLTDAGSTMTKGVTLPLLAIGGISIKTAIDFETAFAGVRKTVEGTEKQFASLERGLRDMAVETGTSASGLANIAEAAGALGVPTKDILEFVDVVNKLDVATNLTAEDAATALGKLQNVLGLTSDDFERLASAVVDLGNTGASTESEIVDMALRIAGTGKTVGLTTAEIIAFSAAAADAGIAAERGGTAISKTFQDIAVAVADGGKDLRGFAKIAGVSAEQFTETWGDDPAKATSMFIDGLRRIRKEAGAGGVIKALKELGISESRQIDTLQLLANAQNGVGEKIAQSTKAYKDATAAQTEFDKFQKTNKVQIDKLKTALSEVALELGQALIPVLQDSLPVLRDLIGYVGDAVKWFGRLDPGTRGTLIKIAGGIAVLGPVLRVLGPGVKTLGTLVGWLAKLRKTPPVDLSKVVTGTLPATTPGTVPVPGGAKGGSKPGAVPPVPGIPPALLAIPLIIEAIDAYKRAQHEADVYADKIGGRDNSIREKLANLRDELEKLENSIPRALDPGDPRTWGRAMKQRQEAVGAIRDEIEKLEGDLRRLDGAKVVVDILMRPTLDDTGKKGKVKVEGDVGDIFGRTLEGRAAGGPVVANRAYLIGEVGPEVFVPRTDGTVLPNNTKTSKQTINIGTVQAHDYHDFERQMERKRRINALAGN